MICAHCTEEVASAEACPNCGASPHLDGRFRLAEVVGSGGMGRTYRAVRLDDEATVAVKELPVRQMDSVKAMEMFEREAEVLEQLDHPGIPQFYEDFSAGEGRHLAVYLVQEFIDGATLAEVREREAWSEEDVLAMMAEVLEILAYLHGRDPPVIHRDVKPTNIMRRRESGELVLIDFGSVRSVLEDPEKGGSTVAGTFGYMAPEQFMGRAEPATDIYGLAATAVSLLADRHPREMLDHDRQLQWKSAVDVAPAVGALLDEMLAPSADDRPGAPAALIERIDGIRRGEVDLEVPADEAGPMLPDPPREIPDGFWERNAARVGTHLKFTALWLPIVSLPIGFGVDGLVTGETTGNLGCLLVGSVLFGIVGLWSLYRGLSRWLRFRGVYQNGAETEATITNVGSANYSVGGRSPTRVYYQFEVDGEIYTGEVDSKEYRLGEIETESRVPVLYDLGAPEKNVAVLPEAAGD